MLLLTFCVHFETVEVAWYLHRISLVCKSSLYVVTIPFHMFMFVNCKSSIMIDRPISPIESVFIVKKIFNGEFADLFVTVNARYDVYCFDLCVRSFYIDS